MKTLFALLAVLFISTTAIHKAGNLPDRQFINTVLFDKTKPGNDGQTTNKMDKQVLFIGKSHKPLIAVKWKHFGRTSNRYNILNPTVPLLN